MAVTLVGQTQPAATAGRLNGAGADLPLVYGGREVGQLTVGLRRGERRLSARDRALLDDVAHLAAAAAHEVALTADLRTSREQLVVAREEERRRLRRELHDGLGPALAGLALGVAAASRAAARGDDAPAVTLLTQAQSDVETLLADVRRISRNLTPAALQELGLVGALQQRAAAVTEATGGDVQVQVEIDDLPAQPPSIEVAAYRIASEGLANTLRHANASRCTVRLSGRDQLRIEVSDDGVGLPDNPTRGVGLGSMVERAAEVGGSCTVQAMDGGGTTVWAELPLEAVR